MTDSTRPTPPNPATVKTDPEHDLKSLPMPEVQQSNSGPHRTD